MLFRKKIIETLWERVFELEPDFSKRKEIALLEKREEELFGRLKKELSEDAVNILMEYSDVVTLLCIEAESYFYKNGMKDGGRIRTFIQTVFSGRSIPKTRLDG
ncbi:MAG TPA: hypothetical protein VF941_12885 [Clostridia bacterium]